MEASSSGVAPATKRMESSVSPSLKLWRVDVSAYIEGYCSPAHLRVIIRQAMGRSPRRMRPIPLQQRLHRRPPRRRQVVLRAPFTPHGRGFRRRGRHDVVHILARLLPPKVHRRARLLQGLLHIGLQTNRRLIVSQGSSTGSSVRGMRRLRRHVGSTRRSSRSRRGRRRS